MKTNFTTLRSFFLILTLQLLAVNSLSAQTSPQALLDHIEDSGREQAGIDQRPHTYIEIDQLAFYENIQLLRTQLLGDDTQMMVVIKSDAYGHGLEMLANVAEMAGVNYFGVTENHSLATMRSMHLNLSLIHI